MRRDTFNHGKVLNKLSFYLLKSFNKYIRVADDVKTSMEVKTRFLTYKRHAINTSGLCQSLSLTLNSDLKHEYCGTRHKLASTNNILSLPFKK